MTLPALKELTQQIKGVTDGQQSSVEGIRAELWRIFQIPKLSATERNRLQCDAVVEWLHQRGKFYHLATKPDFNGSMYFDGERKLLLHIRADAFLAWLSDLLGMNRGERGFLLVQSAVETESLTDRATAIEPARYWAGHLPGAVYISNGPGHIVKITSGGVAMVDNGTDGVLFSSESVLPPWNLADPVDPFETCTIFSDMSVAAPHGKLLFQLWAMSLPTDQRTKPPLTLSGTVGSGKTRVIVGIFELYGLPPRVGAVTKSGENDFWAAMDGGGLCCFDNADTRVDWLPDALAAAATAGCQEKRRLYTDSERVILRPRSWVAVTSANPSFAADAGLSDRLLVVRLNRRKGGTAEAKLSDEVLAARDAGLSWICRMISAALADTAPVPDGLNQRHPDFAAFAARLGRAMGCEAETVAALQAAEADKSLFNLENDFIGMAILESMRGGEPFNGTAAELLERLKTTDPSLEGQLSTKRLSKRMKKLWPHIEAVFNAKQEDGHGGILRFSLKPPRGGGFGGIETAFSEKSYARENMETFTELPSESHQNHQDSLLFQL